MKKSRIIQIAVGILFTAGGLYIFFRDVDIARLGGELKTFHPAAILSCSGLMMLSLWLRAIRWRVMLPRLEQTHQRRLFPVVVIAFMVNNILPARLGEAARVFFVWKRNRYPVMVGLGSVVLERIIDSIFFALSAAIPVLLVTDPAVIPYHRSILPGYENLTIRHLALIITAGCCAPVFLAALYGFFPGPFRVMAARCSGLLPDRIGAGARKLGTEIAANLDWLFRPRDAAIVAILSALVVLPFPAMLFVLIGRWDIAGFAQGCFAQFFASFGASIPSSPGYVGTLHAVLLEGLSLIGIPRENGRAITILYHAASYVPVTLIGLYFFFTTNVSMKDLSEAQETVKEQ